MANLREGFNREDHEALPEKWFGTEGFKDYVTEQPLERQEAERMIEDYYGEWGWDRKTGIPTAQGLDALGLTNL